VAPAPEQISAVLFDLDGTLVDTERQNAEAIGRVMHSLGHVMTEDDKQYVIGHGWREIYQRLAGKAETPVTFDELLERAADARAQIVAEEGLDILPGAVALVERVAKKWPTALVSGSSRREIEACLHALGVGAHFRFFVGAEDVPRGKPAPDGYLQAAKRLAIDPQRAVVLEDSTAGIAAARAAGMRCIAVRAGNFAKQAQDQAHHIVDSLVDVDDALLVRLVESA
jgi:HAD superfamily hydrolase (TIGR01509 family)